MVRLSPCCRTCWGRWPYTTSRTAALRRLFTESTQARPLLLARVLNGNAERVLLRPILSLQPGNPFEQHETRYRDERTHHEEPGPAKPGSEPPCGRRCEHPRHTHETGQKRILCCREALVGERRHEAHECRGA